MPTSTQDESIQSNSLHRSQQNGRGRSSPGMPFWTVEHHLGHVTFGWFIWATIFVTQCKGYMFHVTRFDSSMMRSSAHHPRLFWPALHVFLSTRALRFMSVYIPSRKLSYLSHFRVLDLGSHYMSHISAMSIQSRKILYGSANPQHSSSMP
ncbi:hypothetical protein ASPWEDRAFT_597248 [Aspergillus wentii DTO 134E9]|uniref:Uncharacterized protein n=1 Tax=Aspergillus wentii DTO 134E9 TaxID=1073089 RepID=A0A1L9RD56_ASPWE|nr:uncharacterized protein ASPWEDRAFT_597248 [Aspergillus wentii DTO 134E9]OJJ32879.1 hypothetical protein ASPWEDRAFT_597248 [Aspergillus wentii DTO 134E9]